MAEEVKLEGLTAKSLAEKFGTPLYVYSKAGIEGTFTKLKDALSKKTSKHLICFAVKGFFLIFFFFFFFFNDREKKTK